MIENDFQSFLKNRALIEKARDVLILNIPRLIFVRLKDFIRENGNDGTISAQRLKTNPRCARIIRAFLLNRNGRAVEFGQAEAVKLLVVAGFLVAQDADGEGFAEQHRFGSVRAPVNARRVASERDVGSHFV